MKNKIKKEPVKDILNFISEAGMLKQVKRSGWSVLGIKNAETVAEHSFRCVVIGYTLACMEKVLPYKVLLMTLFNDLHEARITDLHKMAQRYIDAEAVEKKAFYEQVNSLPNGINRELIDLNKEYRKQKTKQSIIARDADILECLIQAKEYCGQGFLQAAKFMKKAPRFLKTKSAQKLWHLAKETDLNQWWFNLSEFKR
ncbi:MAG: HD domain-containing protein [Candidatus Omnitrophota bacterium]|nr:HD domain-containing protein [Candidatus Omnitrophota bacterium]